jgi:hypothetical protein
MIRAGVRRRRRRKERIYAKWCYKINGMLLLLLCLHLKKIGEDVERVRV